MFHHCLFLSLSFAVSFVFCRHAPLGNSGIQPLPDLYEASISELQAGMDAGHYSSRALVQAYISRIEEVNTKGPSLHTVLELNPKALEQAEELDHERRINGKRGPMHGIPVLLKDNIGTVASEGMNTTAGSFSLLGSIVQDDATVVKRLRRAGALILGKTNLSEFAHYRGNLPNGWSGRGGQATSAYYPNADPCGSSSGSAVAVSIGLTAVSLGTETDGSIVCPAAFNNVVGIKPTVGLTSRIGVVPVSYKQDTVGPFGRSVTDAAVVLSVIAGGVDDNLPQSNSTLNFTRALSKSALKGRRIGVPRHKFWSDDVAGGDPSIDRAFSQALVTIQNLGATVIDPADLPSADEIRQSNSEMTAVQIDMKIQLNQYLASLRKVPSGIQTLADIIQFNNDNVILEKPNGYEDQSGLIDAEATDGFNVTYVEALKHNHELGAIRGIDAVLKKHRLDALVLPLVGHVTTASAMAGYPMVSVPLGFFPDSVKIVTTGPKTVYPAPGVPFGLLFFGTAHSDHDLISFAYAYEQETHTRLARRAYSEALPMTQL